jgi:hypothetical protein
VAEKKRCFIIMPITTPESMVTEYNDGAEHFRHVLDALFIPSVKEAGYDPVLPKAKGADLIHAAIVENLEAVDMVLCDMSCLNPNVFFEFGIRTSLNKPVCVVRDELTKKVPFDAGILNHLEYMSDLAGWRIESERERLTKHIVESASRSGNGNTLWKYFGMKTTARAYEADAGSGNQLEYLTLQMESIREKIDRLSPASGSIVFGKDDRVRIPHGHGIVSGISEADAAAYWLRVHLEHSREVVSISTSVNHPGIVFVQYMGEISSKVKKALEDDVKRMFNAHIVFFGEVAQ